MSDLTVTQAAPLGMITLRGAPDVLGPALKAVTGCAMPAMRMRETGPACAVLWMSPDEVLVVCDADKAGPVAAKLAAELAGAFATVADVSDARAVFDVAGQGAETALTKLAPVDFARLGPSEVRRTRLAQVAAALWAEGAGWRVVCFRSVADFVEGLLRNATGTDAADPEHK